MRLPRGPMVVRTVSLLAALVLCGVAAAAAAATSPVQAALEQAAAQKGTAAPAAAAEQAAPSPGGAPDAARPEAASSSAALEAETGGEAPRAQESLFSPAYQNCMDEAAGVTTAMQVCMEAEQTRLERQAADLRGRLAQALPQERAAALTKALEAWESLRRNGSIAMYAPEGGSLSPLMASLWHLEQTARMARWLEGLTENLDQ
ncbi:lysozyme inhibitor LprI family protein [Desulfovibrio legallii]|uniref:Lysozyme inhibitor LprI-like N-terminal domain-containing protein n=1 Tax=Desulfovibrio legallii TaxID=571438 RepID=A0A1G7LHI0_9BACT|nr:lysozyme inhibitor LprI family protein [Desulfovibrio legallii]SDF48935.1 hypothetical protein SAMN05192586_10678 [Desulfovibrio legallii]